MLDITILETIRKNLNEYNLEEVLWAIRNYEHEWLAHGCGAAAIDLLELLTAEDVCGNLAWRWLLLNGADSSGNCSDYSPNLIDPNNITTPSNEETPDDDDWLFTLIWDFLTKK